MEGTEGLLNEVGFSNLEEGLSLSTGVGPVESADGGFLTGVGDSFVGTGETEGLE
jgi:hypothetical protein